MKSILFFIFLFFCSIVYTQSYSQSSKLSTKERDKIRKILILKVTEAKREFDDSNLKYAVSFCDNTPLIELNEKFEKYQKAFQEYTKLTSEGELLQEDAILINDLGELYYAFNKFSQAESAFKEAKRIFHILGLRSTIENAQVFNNLSLTYLATGRYTLSEIEGDSARNLRAEILPEESSLYAMSLNNLGVLYCKLGDLNKAEEYISESVRINEKALTKRSIPYTIAINNKAMVLYNKGKFEDAEELFIESLRLAYDILKERSLTYGRIMINIVSLYRDIERFQDAEVMCLKAIKNKENRVGISHPDLAGLYNILGALYMQPSFKKLHQSEEVLKKSISVIRKSLGEKHPMLIDPMLLLADYNRINKKEEEAELILSNALSIATEALHSLDLKNIKCFENVGLLSWQRKKVIEAGKYLKVAVESCLKSLSAIYKVLPDPEKNLVLSRLHHNIKNFYSFSATYNKSAPTLATDAFNYNLAANTYTFNNQRGNRSEVLKTKDQKSLNNFITWMDLKEHIYFIYNQPKRFIAEEGIDIEVLEREANALFKSLSVKHSSFDKNFKEQTLDCKNLLQAIEKTDVLVQVVKFPLFSSYVTDTIKYAALLLSKDKAVPKILILEDGVALDGKYFQNYKKNLRLNTKDEESYLHYFGKIANEVNKEKDLYFSCEGVYQLINLRTLLEPSGEYLGQTRKITQLASFNYLINYKKKKGSTDGLKDALLVGYPEYGSKGIVPRLPGSLNQVENLKRILDSLGFVCELLTQRNASESKLKSKKDYELLHLATHATINSPRYAINYESSQNQVSRNDMLINSGLVLAGGEKAITDKWEDGVLTSKEISELYFAEDNLVVLSYVDTWKQDVNYDDLHAILSAFKSAGAKAIVVSLWKPEDTISMEFLNAFYIAYSETKNVSKAYNDAEKIMVLKYKYPYNWGSFILVN